MKKTKAKDLSEYVNLLAEAEKEEEVRLRITSAMGIANALQVVGDTDGYWEGRLFEFKFDKKFHTSSKWNKSAYGTLAQALYYCRRILNFEMESKGIDKLPHSIVICDKNGGYVVPSEPFEGLLHYDSANFASRIEVRDALKSYYGKEWLKVLNDQDFSWDAPPSSQNEVLTAMLMERKALSGIQYHDFSDAEQLSLFIKAVKESNSPIPRIPITIENFRFIFDRWFKLFASKTESRREWADRYVIDLRDKFKLNKKTGQLKNETDEWFAPIDVYENFWKLYKRPPADAVDQFIATNKDLLYAEDDQNNYGDFYTPIKLVNLAHTLMSRSMVKNDKKRLWWDPAAGGGNLFFRFNNAKNVILSTKFKNDCDGLKNNPSVKSSQVIQLDFIKDMIEIDLLQRNRWADLKNQMDKADEVVFFLNPPFDDQAESRGTNESLPENFFQHEDASKISARALRAIHTRFFYRILSIARTINKPVWVAAFSKTAWVVGPDGESFYKVWANEFEFKNGLLISSKVFNGVREEWPCLFSIWKFDPDKKAKNEEEMSLPVYDKEYNMIGEKVLRPFNADDQRLSDIAKVDKTLFQEKIKVAPLKNEYEVDNDPWEDELPKNAVGYLRKVANDVYNGSQGLQLCSSMYGPSNHNGVAIINENFDRALAIYGIRKSVRRTWLNDKDEFYLPKRLTRPFNDLIRKAVVFALVDGGYTSSMGNLRYHGNNYSFRNEFCIASPLQIRNWGSEDVPKKSSMAVEWIKDNKDDFTELEKNAISAGKNLIAETLKEGIRAHGDPKRQISRGDASFRQLINGLLDYEGVELPEELQKRYKEYKDAKEKLRVRIESDVYKIGVLTPFFSSEELGELEATKKKIRRSN
jgi:hypothetical protein